MGLCKNHILVTKNTTFQTLTEDQDYKLVQKSIQKLLKNTKDQLKVNGL